MENRQHNLLDMFSRVIKLATDNQTITNTIGAFSTAILQLIAKKGLLVAKAGEQGEDITGFAKDKGAARNVLDEVSFSVISPVVAYAFVNKDNDLRDKMNHPVSFIQRVHDDEIVSWANTRLSIVDDIETSPGSPLGEYGITNANIVAWQSAIDEYSPEEVNPAVAIGHHKTITGDLKTLFDEANSICNNLLDPLAIGFKEPEEHYYNDYLNARNIIDLGKGTTILEVSVKFDNGVELLPVWKAVVTDSLTGDSVETDTEGFAQLKPIERGERTITIEAEGFITQISEPFEIKQGTTTVLEILLVAVA